MAIDTVYKRKSVINTGLPGLALLPYTDGLIQAYDRRRLADFYSLNPQVIAHNFWVPDRRESVITWSADSQASEPTWKQDQRPAQAFTKDERSSTSWTQSNEPDTDWTEESEVTE